MCERGRLNHSEGSQILFMTYSARGDKKLSKVLSRLVCCEVLGFGCFVFVKIGCEPSIGFRSICFGDETAFFV